MGFVQQVGSGILESRVDINTVGWPHPAAWSPVDSSLKLNAV